MRRMTLTRLGAGALLSLGILTVWLGACASGNESCGLHGSEYPAGAPGTCHQGTTCPTGTTFLNISDPADECPQSGNPDTSYICCVPSSDSGSSASSPAATAPADSGTKG